MLPKLSISLRQCAVEQHAALPPHFMQISSIFMSKEISYQLGNFMAGEAVEYIGATACMQMNSMNLLPL